MEPKFGKYTFGIRLDHDARVIKSIQRYPKTLGVNAIRDNPETILIYEYDRELPSGQMVKEVDYISCPSHHTLHQNFGYRYQYLPSPGEYIGEGTVLAQSPAIAENGNYMFGLETNIAMMSVPQIIEDGVVASESFCKRMTTTGIETYVVSFGKNKYPLNIYGDYDNYKIHPDIGEHVGEDGILMAMRRYDDELAPVNMSRASLRKPDFKYDERVYVEPGAKIVDVRVSHDERLRGVIRGKGMNTPVGMHGQPDKYLTADQVFYRSVLNEYKRLYASRKEALRITPRFHNLLVQAQAATTSGDKRRMMRTYRGVPIDEWRIEITVEYPIVPTIGFKLTGCHGDKGVLCDIRPDEDMPIDADGNRAELIMDGLSAIKRMNVSRCMEQYLNACSRDVSKKVRAMVEAGDAKEAINNYLLPYYQIVSPRMVVLVSENGMVTDEHIESVVKDGIYLWQPTDNEVEPMDVIKQLNAKYPPTFGPVSYRGMSGIVKRTANDVLIGSMYIMLLEKTGRNWAGVASSKLSHFGTPAKLTSADRHSSPGRNQPIRFGESEGRLFVAMVGGQETAELFDRTNNPVVRKAIQERILREAKPTAINEIVDRKKYPSGNGRILSLVRHFGECAGWRFKREVTHND
jgi:DNA-directed RNA polymerase beta subunit